MIYDDDCDQDFDCAITQPILHHWIDMGYAKVWGEVSSGHSQLGAPSMRVFRDYYGHSSLFSIGAWTPGCAASQSSVWNIAIVDKFDPGDICTNYEPCQNTLRRAIATFISAGGSYRGIDYVITGPLTCEEALRLSPPDAISPLTGAEMERQYIRQFVVMNGDVPSGKEYNCISDPQACSTFFAVATAGNGYPPVDVVPDNLGTTAVVTKVPVEYLPQSNPSAYASAVSGAKSASDEDALAVEFAVFGLSGWEISGNSQNTVDLTSGVNTWMTNIPVGQYYLMVPGDEQLFEQLLDPPWTPTDSHASGSLFLR